MVGRDSTALVELIKNCYDADATSVVVYGESLEAPERGFIRITDNGTGMAQEEFRAGFLRIASRGKGEGDRRSGYYGRKYTGAKGIGRLAAHKLAKIIEVESLRWDGKQGALMSATGVSASISWDLVETKDTLDQIEGTDAITVKAVHPPPRTRSGTTITLRRLRRAWTKAAHQRFLDEVQSFAPPPPLVDPLSSQVVPATLIFSTPILRDATAAAGRSFQVTLEGELSPSDSYWAARASSATWILEIEASRAAGTVRYVIAPTLETAEEFPDAKRREFSVRHPTPDVGPFFQARILLRAGKAWEGSASGIRVFVEGFRVLPYGEPRNDWLSLDRDASTRGSSRFSESGEGAELRQLIESEESDSKVALLILPNKHYFGAVFLTQDGSQHLHMLVNREGFVPDAAYESMVTIVRGGIDLLTRVRAAASEKQREQRRRERAKNRSGDPTAPRAGRIRSSLDGVHRAFGEARSLLAAGNAVAARTRLEQAQSDLAELSGASEELVTEATMLRVLASVGTQLAAFVHEINGLVGTAEAVDFALRKLRSGDGKKLSREQAGQIAVISRFVGDLRQNLERQATYLVDVITPTARRRRSKQKLAERFDSAARLVAHVAESRGIAIQNAIPAAITTPPMFPAEVTTMFSNLLTNAVKAAGDNGVVRADATRRHGKVAIRVQNTGVAVDPSEGERWFEPFESTTTAVDATLGQGMGLGLPITRSMLTEYGGSIQFVRPEAGFATAVEIELP